MAVKDDWLVFTQLKVYGAGSRLTQGRKLHEYTVH